MKDFSITDTKTSLLIPISHLTWYIHHFRLKVVTQEPTVLFST